MTSRSVLENMTLIDSNVYSGSRKPTHDLMNDGNDLLDATNSGDPTRTSLNGGYEISGRNKFYSHIASKFPYEARLKTGSIGSTIRASLTHLSDGANSGTFSYVKGMNPVLPMKQTEKGELLFRRKRLTVDPFKRVERPRDNEYSGIISDISFSINDAIMAPVDGPDSSAYSISVANMSSYGMVTSLSQLVTQLTGNVDDLKAVNLYTQIVGDFHDLSQCHDVRDLPYDWDPVRTFIDLFQPAGLFINEPYFTGFRTDDTPYQITMATSGSPANAAARAYAMSTGSTANPQDSFDLLVPLKIFVDLDTEEEWGVSYNVYISVVRKSYCKLEFRVIKSRHSIAYVKDKLITPDSDGEFKMSQQVNLYKYSKPNLSGHWRDFGLIHAPLYSAVYKIGRVSKTSSTTNPYSITQSNKQRLNGFIVELGNEWF